MLPITRRDVPRTRRAHRPPARPRRSEDGVTRLLDIEIRSCPNPRCTSAPPARDLRQATAYLRSLAVPRFPQPGVPTFADRDAWGFCGWASASWLLTRGLQDVWLRKAQNDAALAADTRAAVTRADASGTLRPAAAGQSRSNRDGHGISQAAPSAPENCPGCCRHNTSNRC